jgi:hypothetical protein
MGRVADHDNPKSLVLERSGMPHASIRCLRERFLAARQIVSVEQGNRELRAFIDEIAHPRAHPTIPDRTVIDGFQEECVRLLPLPDTPFAT